MVLINSSTNLPYLFMHCTWWIIKESVNVLLAVHNIYGWCLGILNLLCWLIMNIPKNCVWNIGFKWAITKYFRGMYVEVVCGKFNRINADINRMFCKHKQQRQMLWMVVKFCSMCMIVKSNKMCDYIGLNHGWPSEKGEACKDINMPQCCIIR